MCGGEIRRAITRALETAVMRRSVGNRLMLACLVGVAQPYIELARKCRSGYETSDACVIAPFPMQRGASTEVKAPRSSHGVAMLR